MIGEATESFSITLERMFDLDSRITLDPNRAEVDITNDDGKVIKSVASHCHTYNIYH